MSPKNQINLFEVEKVPTQKPDSKYTSKIKSPIYIPKGRKPFPQELVDINRFSQLLQHIENSNVSEDEKIFLRYAAARHLVFNFEKIADYYAHADKEMQELMEESALVIIDFEKAIEQNLVILSEKMEELFLGECEDE